FFAPVPGAGLSAMTDAFVFPAINLRAMLPVLVVTAAALIVLLLDLLPPSDRKDHLGVVALMGGVGSLFATVALSGADERAFGGMLLLDSFALFFNLIIGWALGLVLLLSLDYVRRQGMETGEFYVLVLFSAVGMMLMASAGDLIMVFLGLETMSIALYVLAGFFRERIESGEASLKYFLLGAFAS